MHTTTINSVGVYKNLKEAGIPEAQAEAIAMTFYEHDELIIKKMSDMLDAKLADLRTNIILELKVELHSTLRVHLYAIIAMFIGLGVFSRFFPV